MSTNSLIGQPAPDFTLSGWAHGEQSEYTLSARLGQPVVLAFYPADSSAVCTKQMCSYSDNLDEFSSLNAVVWGISGRDVQSKRSFAEKQSLEIPLLADPDQKVAKAYGIVSKLGLRRSVFVVDKGGKVAWSHSSALGLTYRTTSQIVEVLLGLEQQ